MRGGARSIISATGGMLVGGAFLAEFVGREQTERHPEVAGRLEQRGVITTGLRVRWVDVHRCRVVGTQGEHGRRPGRVRHGQERQIDDQELEHGAVCSIRPGPTTLAAG